MVISCLRLPLDAKRSLCNFAARTHTNHSTPHKHIPTFKARLVIDKDPMAANASPNTPASHAVFATNELLTTIFCHLGTIELIRCMRVSRVWRTAIQGSLDLNKQLFLARDDSGHEKWYIDETIDSEHTYPWVCISELTQIELDFTLREHNTVSEIYDDAVVVPVKMNPLIKHEGTEFAAWGWFGEPYGKFDHEAMGLERLGETPPSWRKMLASQPPAAKGIFMDSSRAVCGEDCTHELELCDNGMPVDGDATMGQMMDRVIETECHDWLPPVVKGDWRHVGVFMLGIVVPTDAEREQVKVNTRNVQRACAEHYRKLGQAEAKTELAKKKCTGS